MRCRYMAPADLEFRDYAGVDLEKTRLRSGRVELAYLLPIFRTNNWQPRIKGGHYRQLANLWQKGG